MEDGADFSFSGRCHHIPHDVAGDVDGAIDDRGWGIGAGVVSGAEEEEAAASGAGLGF